MKPKGGRPPKPGGQLKTMTIRVSAELADWIRANGGTAMVRTLIINRQKFLEAVKHMESGQESGQESWINGKTGLAITDSEWKAMIARLPADSEECPLTET